MVKTQPGKFSSTIGIANNTLRGRSNRQPSFGRWSAPALPADNRLSLDRRAIATSPRLTVQNTQQSSARQQLRAKRNLMQRGESIAIMTIVAGFAVLCLAGIVYLAAYAKVAQQGRELMTLQADLATANANHEIYVQQVTQLSSSQRINPLAQRYGMVLNAPSKYVPLNAGNSAALSTTEVAMGQ